MLTDLPVPVAPAIRKWGIFSRPAKTGLPETSLPRARGIKYLDFLYSSCSNIPLRPTIETRLLGTSIPTNDLPGIGASILMGWAANARDRSELRTLILDNLTPIAGRSVNLSNRFGRQSRFWNLRFFFINHLIASLYNYFVDRLLFFFIFPTQQSRN